MSEGFEQFVFRCIERALALRSPHRIGLVTSYDPKTHAVKLMRKPEDVESGFIPIGTGHIGAGWGVAVGPQIGDQYVMGFVGGDITVPFIAGRLFSDKEVPPTVQSGEILVKHQSGSLLNLKPDGSIVHTSAQGMQTTAGQAMALQAGQAINLTAGAPMTFTGGGNLA
jgi:uncharacterized protein involved in type VI secretion and phage assembly